MNAQPALDFTAREYRDLAIDAVDQHADPDWKAAALAAVRAVAEELRLFTTDDVEPRVEGAETHEPRAWGAVMQQAARNGWCVATPEYRESKQPRCHARPKRVWASLLVNAEAA